MDNPFQAKVGDFGLARQGEDYCSQGSKFPVKWTAPEAIQTKRFNNKVPNNTWCQVMASSKVTYKYLVCYLTLEPIYSLV